MAFNLWFRHGGTLHHYGLKTVGIHAYNSKSPLKRRPGCLVVYRTLGPVGLIWAWQRVIARPDRMSQFEYSQGEASATLFAILRDRMRLVLYSKQQRQESAPYMMGAEHVFSMFRVKLTRSHQMSYAQARSRQFD